MRVVRERGSEYASIAVMASEKTCSPCQVRLLKQLGCHDRLSTLLVHGVRSQWPGRLHVGALL